MKFHFFHLMPYPDLPSDFRERYRSVWVDAPASELYDPVVGNAAYHDYLDELEFAAEMGFDGICVNEHHQCGYGLMPSPNLMAAALSRRTTQAKIVVMGNSVALYNPPIRVAEEMAMIDVLSGGRLVAGFPVGTVFDTAFSYGTNPATLREKYREGVELVLRAWSATEPFAFNGKFTQLRYVNPWPRPMQKPRPPVWVPGSGSIETWDWCVEHDFLYAYLSYYGYLRAKETMDGFWEAVERLGVEPNPYRAGFLQFVGVADDDAQAEKLYADAALYFYNRSFHIYAGFTDAPGYTSIPTIRRGIKGMMQRKTGLSGPLTWKDIVDRGYVVAGSPDTVVDRLNELAGGLNVGHLMLLLQFGNLGRESVMYNTRRFAEEVIPRLRGRFDEWEDHWWPRERLGSGEAAAAAPAAGA